MPVNPCLCLLCHKILKGISSCRRTIYDDAFIRQYIEDLLKNIRTQVVLKLIQPYTRIRIPFISRQCLVLLLFCDVPHTYLLHGFGVPRDSDNTPGMFLKERGRRDIKDILTR